MNYKALEDLINILVRKCGTELNADIAKKEIVILENRLKKIRSDIESLREYISNNDYKYTSKYEKENSYIELLKSDIDNLVNKKSECLSELKEYEKLEEDGVSHIESLIKEKEALEQYANCLNRDRNYFLLEKSSKYDEYNSKYLEVKNNLNNEINEIEKYNLLLEQAKEIDSELEKLNKEYENITSVNKEFIDVSDKVKDELRLEELLNEENILINKIEKWQKNPELIGKTILEEYNKGTTIEDVNPLIEELIEYANNEYKKTSIEVKESNIFGTMDKYNKNINYISSEVSKGSYKDLNRQDYLSTIKGYHKDKLKLNKTELENLYKKKEEYSSLINVITLLKDEIKKRRINSQRELISYESRLFDANMVNISESDMKEFDKLISSIKDEITENTNLEYEYSIDIENYEEKLNNIENRISSLEKFISTFEEKVNNIMINSPKSGFVDSKKLLNDKLLLVEYDNRLKSISNQQQYLYVDSKVIKEEIMNLWNVKDEDNILGDEIEDYTYEEDIHEELENEPDDILVIDDIEDKEEVKNEENKIEEILEEDDTYDIFENSNSFMEL
jgi:DNA repair exonuclease SbcCD ATPase subunit